MPETEHPNISVCAEVHNTFASHQQKDQSLEKCILAIQKPKGLVLKKVYSLESLEQTNKAEYNVISTDIIET